jgi:hypothetical protein
LIKYVNIFINSIAANADVAGLPVSREKPSVNKEKSLKFCVGSGMPTASSKEGQYLKGL